MNTTKTELLEEFLIPEKFVTEHLRGDQEPLFELHGDVQELHHLLKQHFSKALDRYRDSVVEEEREKIEKLDAYYVLNGSIEKHKGGHLLDKDDVLKILND